MEEIAEFQINDDKALKNPYNTDLIRGAGIEKSESSRSSLSCSYQEAIQKKPLFLNHSF